MQTMPLLLGAITYLTDRAGHEAKSYPGPQPAVFQDSACALKMEHMGAVQLGIKKQKKKQVIPSGLFSV